MPAVVNVIAEVLRLAQCLVLRLIDVAVVALVLPVRVFVGGAAVPRQQRPRSVRNQQHVAVAQVKGSRNDMADVVYAGVVLRLNLIAQIDGLRAVLRDSLDSIRQQGGLHGKPAA